MFESTKEIVIFVCLSLFAVWRIGYMFRLRRHMEKEASTDMQTAFEIIDKYDFECDKECWIDGMVFVVVFLVSCAVGTYYSTIPAGLTLLFAYWFRNYKLRVDIGPEVVNPKYVMKTSVQTASDVLGSVTVRRSGNVGTIAGNTVSTMANNSLRNADDFIDTNRKSATLEELRQAAECLGISIDGKTRQQLCVELVKYSPDALYDATAVGNIEFQAYMITHLVLDMNNKGLI